MTETPVMAPSPTDTAPTDTAPTVDQASERSAVPPTRFRAGEDRAARIGRPLRVLGRVGALDEDLMERLGRGFTEVDEVGAALARALRLGVDDPDRVSMAQLRAALDGRLPSDAPPALRAFMAAAGATPDWVDLDLVEEGARVFRRFGRNAADVLLQLSLIGGYRFGGPTDLLVATGGLSGDMTLRRLGETQKWAVAVGAPGGMRPGGEGFALTLHVRAMHALVNESFTPRWDVARWGMPINQSDQAATLGLFSGVPLLGCRALGVPISRADSRAVMHLWKYVGWLTGVDEQWLVDTEREQHRLSYHVLRAQAGLTEAGPQLAGAIVKVQDQLHIDRLAGLRRRYAKERLLSMLTGFLGPRSMRELGLPARPPWAMVLVVAANVLRYRVLARTAVGERWLLRWSDRVREDVLRRNFGPEDEAQVGRLPV